MCILKNFFEFLIVCLISISTLYPFQIKKITAKTEASIKSVLKQPTTDIKKLMDEAEKQHAGNFFAILFKS